ncbi:hydantoinase/oxoprolinase family protein [Pseudorhodoferax sp.]|uniref:hydantoinase/oxoprolinase family protein n=1 Tax=Pseudorhodoferax sp. TaxID=1993553 RepID=UPI002DD652F9|nr:hydantoinase/oxoprolinase family protein [Pseudorhodoferax sp.]
MLRVGVDVGGTNTDAAVMDGLRLLGAHKSPTTPDVTGGIVAAVQAALAAAGQPASALRAVMIGTTHFTNALVERRRLAPVAVVRLALPATTGVLPFADWPPDLRPAVGDHVYLVGGGHEYDGRVLTALDEAEVVKVAHDMKRRGLTQAALTGVFAPVNPAAELRAAEILRQEHPEVQVSLSHRLGGIGLLERENAAVLNAALMPEAVRVTAALEQAMQRLGVAVPLFISQNDGTLMAPREIGQYPVLTFASGPTNSMRGAAFLSGLQDALVVDIGGTTSDVGVLANGFPRQAGMAVRLAGVRTNFRMPDLLAIGLGGGSLVREHADGRVTIGPDSVGYRLTDEALVFGGSTLTATDIAVAAGMADIGDRSRVARLPATLVNQGLACMRSLLEEAVDRVKTSAAPVPVVLVGGGAILAGDALAGASAVIRPAQAGCANAIGASIAQVSGEFDSILTYTESTRARALDDARAAATQRALDAGAAPGSVSIYSIEEMPMAYLPGGGTRVHVKAIGDLALEGAR